MMLRKMLTLWFLLVLAPESKNLTFILFPLLILFHSCIGQKFAILEEKCVVSMVLRKLKIHVIEDQKIDLFPALISRPEFGIKVRFTRREDEY